IQLGFYRIAAILGHSLSLGETYNAVAQAASEALGGAFAAVLLPSAKRLELVGAHELPDSFRSGVATATDALVDAAREGRVLAASALAEDDRFDEEWRARAARCGCGALLAVPFERARGKTGEAALGTRSPTTGPLAGDVVQSRAPVAVESAVDEPRLARADPVVAAGCASYLGVPLVGPEGALHGVLSVYGERPRAWRPEEVEALRALAGNTSA